MSSHCHFALPCLAFMLGVACAKAEPFESASQSTASAGVASSTEATTAAPTTQPPVNPAPYANVTAVTVSGDADAYTFTVSVESNDRDCSQFADWWEVISDSKTLLYRRILTHSHTDENGTSDPDAPGNTFTREGGPVPVAAAQTVYVRAHMNTGGYNGQVMAGSAASGFAATEVPAGFAAELEQLAPQATSCSF